MKVSFFGAAQEVGRSCIMISSGNTSILLDAGIKLGETEQLPTIPDALLKRIDAVFITHAHLDHSGYLPHIFSAGYTGKVYATKPTLELVNVMIADYMHISNPSNVSKDGLARMHKSYEIVEYGETVKVKDLNVTLLPAGHILGSAMLYVSDGKQRLLYTGDINLSKTRLLDGADTKNITAETLITESTYGAKEDIAPSEGVVAKQHAHRHKGNAPQREQGDHTLFRSRKSARGPSAA